MLKRSVNRGGSRTNGRVNFHRANGQFAPKQSLNAKICPCCNAINIPKQYPRYVGSTIDPTSMRPVYDAVCHSCGHDYTMTSQQAINQLMAEVF